MNNESKSATITRLDSSGLKRKDFSSARAKTLYFAAREGLRQQLDSIARERRFFPPCSLRAICFHRPMPKSTLQAMVSHCDRILRIREIGDYDGAVNGLQVENSGTVTRIAAAVDASPATVNLAAAAKASLLVVHHGLFWNVRQPWTGANHDLIRALVLNDLAVYSAHLPL